MHTFSTQELSRRCTQESIKREPPQPAPHCVELFRRALQGNNEAGTLLYHQYHRLIYKWVNVLHPAENDDLVQDSFMRFLQASPDALSGSYLAPLLDYWRTLTERLALARRRAYYNRWRTETSLSQGAGESNPTGEHEEDTSIVDSAPGPEELAIEREQQQRLRACLARHLKTDLERLIVELFYQWHWTPRAIQEAYPEQVASREACYAVLQRVHRRFEKDTELRGLLKFRRISVVFDSGRKTPDTPEGGTPMYPDCKVSEVDLLDYILGEADARLVARIRSSPACLAAAHTLKVRLEPAWHALYRLDCPDVDSLVGYQAHALVSNEQLVVARHVRRCLVCQEELALLQAVEQIPYHAEPLAEGVRRVLRGLFVSPLSPQVAHRGEAMQTYEVEGYSVVITQASTDSRPRRWMLFGQVYFAQTPLDESGTVRLVDQISGAPLDALDALDAGYFEFSSIAAGQYDLLLTLDTIDIHIHDLVVRD